MRAETTRRGMMKEIEMNAPQDTPGQTPEQTPEQTPVQTPVQAPVQSYAPPPPPPQEPQAQGGFQAQFAFDPRSKSPVVASFLSVVPGLGQVYIGQYWIAFVHILVFAGSIAIMANDPTEAMLPLLPIFLFFFWLYNIIDAGRRAAMYNYAVQGGAGIDLPKGTMPRTTGSIAAGLVLVVGGFLVLMHTKFGFSLDWVEDWWPLAPIGFGLWLVARAIQDRKEEA